MTESHTYHYEKVRKFTLVKETPDAIRVRLENHPEKISIWMPKKVTRGYTDTSAWFWSEAFHNNVRKEEQKLKDQKENMEIPSGTLMLFMLLSQPTETLKKLKR